MQGGECRELMVLAKLKGLTGAPSGEAMLRGKQRKALFIFLFLIFFRKALLTPLCAGTGGRQLSEAPGGALLPRSLSVSAVFSFCFPCTIPPSFPGSFLGRRVLRVWGAHSASQLSLRHRKTKTGKEKALISRPVSGRLLLVACKHAHSSRGLSPNGASKIAHPAGVPHFHLCLSLVPSPHSLSPRRSVCGEAAGIIRCSPARL